MSSAKCCGGRQLDEMLSNPDAPTGAVLVRLALDDRSDADAASKLLVAAVRAARSHHMSAETLKCVHDMLTDALQAPRARQAVLEEMVQLLKVHDSVGSGR
jgi:hypothetical protein